MDGTIISRKWYRPMGEVRLLHISWLDPDIHTGLPRDQDENHGWDQMTQKFRATAVCSTPMAYARIRCSWSFPQAKCTLPRMFRNTWYTWTLSVSTLRLLLSSPECPYHHFQRWGGWLCATTTGISTTSNPIEKGEIADTESLTVVSQQRVTGGKQKPGLRH